MKQIFQAKNCCLAKSINQQQTSIYTPKYSRKDKHKNFQQKSGKNALVTNEGATVN